MTRRRDQEDAPLRELHALAPDDQAVGRRMGRSAQQPAKEVSPPPPRQPQNPVDQARLILGARVTERGGGYWLDNAPVSCIALVREANRVLAREGKPMIGPPSWR